MGLPNIFIEFVKTAVASITVGSSGVVGVILQDASTVVGGYAISDANAIPSDLSTANKRYLTEVFMGSPQKVYCYVVNSAAETVSYDDAYKYLTLHRCNYICGDPEITSALRTSLVTWVKSKRSSGKQAPKAVVPGGTNAEDHEGIIDVKFVGGSTVKAGETTYTAAQLCGRIAGILAGLPLTQSATYYALSEITEIPDATDEDVNTAIDNGFLTLYDTGSGIVIGRAVTSLKTVTQSKTADLKKIKIVAIQDMITMDLTDTINQNYVGKYSNSYDNKCLLMAAIRGYFMELERRGYLMEGRSTIEINVDKQRIYLQSQGVDTSGMDVQAIKTANTGSHVFLKGSVGILDAIEDVDIVITKE